MNDNKLTKRPFSFLLVMAVFAIFMGTAVTHNYGEVIPSSSEPARVAAVIKRAPVMPWSPTLNVVMPSRLKEGVSPYGPGMEQELLEHFLASNSYRVRYHYADSYESAMDLLRQKDVDLMIGFGCEPSFEPENIGRGPALNEFYMMLVVLPDEGLRDFDLSNVHFNKVAYTSAQLATLKKHKGRAVLLDPSTYSLLMPVYPKLQTAGQLAEKTGYYWFWQKRNIILDAELNEFWNKQDTETLMAEMGERYYGFMPKEPKAGQLLEISRAISKGIGIYSAHINKAANANGIDPLLLSAVIFQESRFNPTARSYTGVRGIMQLTLPTADMLGVDRMNPEDAIMGGARYLRSIYDSLEFVEGLSDLDKWCLTLAGFNQGPTVMRRAVKAALAEGLEADWVTMRRYYSALRSKGLANPGFRPKEAVNYVENVRYYYYVLSGLARIGGPERENLAAFLASR